METNVKIGIKDTAVEWFEALETAKGWAGTAPYCHNDATISVQADSLADIETMEDFSNFIKDGLSVMTDGGHEIKAVATNEKENQVIIFARGWGTHTKEGGPVPPTGKSMETEYVYILTFDGGKIRHLNKVWNDVWSMSRLGWM